jgi:hypothetical protein
MRNTGLGLSTFLVAIGAILAWAVTYEADGIDLTQVGAILFIVGLAVGFFSLVMAAVGRRTTVQTARESMVDGRPVVDRQREVIVEQDPNL